MTRESHLIEPKREERYKPSETEPIWQSRWTADRLSEIDAEQAAHDRKFYNLVEFPYPSAEGLHVGHAYTYSGADTYGRYLRMRGREVFQPIGFDSFGIHTENYALSVDEHPRTLTERTIAKLPSATRVPRCGLGLEPGDRDERSLLLPAGYPLDAVDLCEAVPGGTGRQARGPGRVVSVMSHRACERAAGGDRCERCGTRVVQRIMLQWFLRITAYAEDLLRGLEDLDWPESAKRAQREWIGRSEGVEIDFEVPDRGLRLRTFTTRPETLFGVTFLVLPPEHPDLDELAGGTGLEDQVRRYVEEVLRERVVTSAWSGQAAGTRPRGRAFTGSHAVHPATGERVPIYVADYVLATYGTGAVMGVPAHNECGFQFAAANGLPVVEVIRPHGDTEVPANGAWTGEGVLTGSDRTRPRTSPPRRRPGPDRGRRTNKGAPGSPSPMRGS